MNRPKTINTNPRERLKAIKDPVIVHFARSPFDEHRYKEVWGLFIYHNDEYLSFQVDNLDDEAAVIFDFKATLDVLRAKGGTVIHWNQVSSDFGPKFISKRYRDLTGNYLELDYGKDSVNLAYELIKAYGDDYVDHPRLDKLAQLNGWAWGRERSEPCPLFDHNRTALIVKTFYATINGTLKTMDSKYRESLLRTELLDQIKRELRNADAEEKVLTRKQVLKELDICSNTLSNWVRDKKIPYTRIGRRLYFFKSEILNLKF
ncbi:DNA-binding protein [Flagellimonas lutimaris]|uniref:DNA-binding protein n=1 Tax=Flagellimonas lutimaris TaxID=475082 RepID=A0A3A1NB77_9FLAO|nr:helix-turn-helix domain-containing protein [Allomuricauda lutimaris]RIV38150.1 DNA-binding protein [Allomuricauda lutimaris]